MSCCQIQIVRDRTVVERADWLNYPHRLRESYERLTLTGETWIYIAMPRIFVETPGLKREFPNRSQENKLITHSK